MILGKIGGQEEITTTLFESLALYIGSESQSEWKPGLYVRMLASITVCQCGCMPGLLCQCGSTPGLLFVSVAVCQDCGLSVWIYARIAVCQYGCMPGLLYTRIHASQCGCMPGIMYVSVAVSRMLLLLQWSTAPPKQGSVCNSVRGLLSVTVTAVWGPLEM